MEIDPGARNVLVAHQFVTGAARCGSEEILVGGLDNVETAVFEPFDYVALGHIHSPQHVGRETIRYCGTPLKYSFSEAEQKKSVTVVELKEKGKTEIRKLPLKPLRDMRRIRGSYLEVTLSVNGVRLTTNRSLERRGIVVGEKMCVLLYRIYVFDENGAEIRKNQMLRGVDVESL